MPSDGKERGHGWRGRDVPADPVLAALAGSLRRGQGTTLHDLLTEPGFISFGTRELAERGGLMSMPASMPRLPVGASAPLLARDWRTT
ncbi:hypothetical protein ACQEV9_44055 [Streptomyces chartreusis]|uniref:hypothetical protein n=1 Tax=Streptomyces chartreusis TaxID=1969 RepID=UPI003D8AC229